MTGNKCFIPLHIMNGSECDLGTCQERGAQTEYMHHRQF